MKNLLIAGIASLLLSFGAIAQTNTPPPAPTVESSFTDLWNAVSNDKTNWLFEAHALYASGLKDKFGGGIGAFRPLSTYVYTGLRVDYVDGGFWMPSGSAGLQLPIKPFSWLTVTPFTYAGIGIPLSGAKVGTFTLPGQTPKDNAGQPTAILGYGLALRVYTSGSFYVDLVGDREEWTGFPRSQYRGGVLVHVLSF